MGAWAAGPFDNDAAQDWLLSADDGDSVATALDAVGTSGYLDADDGSVAVAAAVLVAAAYDGNMAALPSDASDLARRVAVDAALRARTIAALERVLGDDSELRSLWDDGSDGPTWRASIANIIVRLGGSTKQ